MQAYLKKHGTTVAHHTVKASWKREARKVSLEFTVQKRSGAPWNTDPVFTQDWSKNWGLWNKDVVEAFLQLRAHADDVNAPYLELQLSPLNQPFALIITEPRKTFFAPKTLNMHSEVELEERRWVSRIEVELPEEIQGDLFYAGFFSCLGQEPREFFALEPNPEASPDFHRPELFMPLEQE